MKRILSLFSLIVLGFSLMPGNLVSASYSSSYAGAENSNDYAYSVIQNTGDVLVEKTSAAANTNSNDVTLYKTVGSELYVGYSNPFDGFSAEVYNSATGGSYSVKYWNGTSWATLVSSEAKNLANDSDETFQVEWDRPSSWSKTNILMTTDEDGNSYEYSGSYYFVKVVVDESYTKSASFTQIGIINYNLKVTVEDQFGHTPSSYDSDYTFSNRTADDTVYVSKNDGDGTEYYGFYAPLNGASYSYTATVTGYVEESGSISLDHAQSTLALSLDYTHKIVAKNSDTGSVISISSAYAGTGKDTCVIESGSAYCPVPTSEDGSNATVSVSGYITKTISIPNRTSDGTAQQTSYATMYKNSSSNEPNLTVDDLYFSDEALWAEISNEGDDDVSSHDTVYVYVYVDGHREESSTIAYTYFDADESHAFAFLGGEFDSGESYDLKVCVDATDNVNESDENDNCREETLKYGSSSSHKPDLDVSDIYLDSDDDLNFTITNKGGDDVTNGTDVTIKVYVDGDVEYTKTVSQSSKTTNFLDEGEESTYSAGDILENEGSTYEVKVCVDTSNEVNEESESNNCMTVDEDSIGTDRNESCGDFTDLDGEWSEEYVCDLYERDVVRGRTSTRFYPNSSTTRAEFLKMVLLDAELDPYSVSSMHFSDVSSGSWYYSYVTYAAAHDYIEGYSDGTFKPDQAITRAEALVILMRVADQNDYSFNESDIDFWDVNTGDWFAEAVVIADEDNIIDGYSNGSFGPNNFITRGEAAKILDLAYDEYFN